jgi:hypothetical protein
MDELELRNADARAAWHMRWRLQGGSFHWQARPYMDLRNQEQLRQWRVIEFKRRATGKSKRIEQVVNIAAWKLRRLRNGRQKALRA